MVTSKDGDSVREAHFKGDKESDSLNGVVAAIDVVTHEKIVSVGRLTSNLEQFSQVVELAVNITADGDGSTHLLHVGLVDQDLFRL